MTDLMSDTDMRFHHIGYATHSVARERDFFAAIGYVPEGEAFVDSTQGIAGCFMTGAGPRIELLENLPGSNTLTPWLTAGIKLYHMAYETVDFEQASAWIAKQRAKIIIAPVPAVAFGGRRIMFTMLRNRFLLEFIETQ